MCVRHASYRAEVNRAIEAGRVMVHLPLLAVISSAAQLLSREWQMQTPRFQASGQPKGCYHFTEENIVHLYRHCSEFLGKPATISVKFEGREIANESTEEIFSDSYTRSHLIKALSIEGAAPDKFISVELASQYFKNPVRFSISGNRSDVLATEAQLINEVASCKTAYSNFRFSVIYLIFPTMLIYFYVGFVFGKYNLSAFYNWHGRTALLLLVGLIAIFFLIKALPVLVFYFAHGKARYDRVRAVRNYLLGPVFGGSVLGILVNIITESIKIN